MGSWELLYRQYGSIWNFGYIHGQRKGLRRCTLKIKALAVSANHLCLTESGKPVAPYDLKGVDRIGYELFRTAVGAPQMFIEKVAVDHRRRFYFAAINDIVDLTGSFSVAYTECEFDAEPVEFPAHHGVHSYQEIELSQDTAGQCRVVQDKFRMGDIVLLATSGRAQLAFRGDEELYLGNEAFYGEISTNIGIFAQI